MFGVEMRKDNGHQPVQRDPDVQGLRHIFQSIYGHNPVDAPPWVNNLQAAGKVGKKVKGVVDKHVQVEQELIDQQTGDKVEHGEPEPLPVLQHREEQHSEARVDCSDANSHDGAAQMFL